MLQFFKINYIQKRSLPWILTFKGVVLIIVLFKASVHQHILIDLTCMLNGQRCSKNLSITFSKFVSHMKAEIGRLSRKDLEKLVLKAASMNKQFRDYLLVNYLDEQHGEQGLFEEAKKDEYFGFNLTDVR